MSSGLIRNIDHRSLAYRLQNELADDHGHTHAANWSSAVHASDPGSKVQTRGEPCIFEPYPCGEFSPPALQDQRPGVDLDVASGVVPWTAGTQVGPSNTSCTSLERGNTHVKSRLG